MTNRVLEAVLTNRDFVRADPQVRKAKSALLVGVCGAGQIGLRMPNRDLRPGHDGARRIRHATADAGQIDRLLSENRQRPSAHGAQEQDASYQLHRSLRRKATAGATARAGGTTPRRHTGAFMTRRVRVRRGEVEGLVVRSGIRRSGRSLSQRYARPVPEARPWTPAGSRGWTAAQRERPSGRRRRCSADSHRSAAMVPSDDRARPRQRDAVHRGRRHRDASGRDARLPHASDSAWRAVIHDSSFQRGDERRSSREAQEP